MTDHLPRTSLTTPAQAAAGEPTRFAAWKRWFAPAAIAVLVADLASKSYLFNLPPGTKLPRWIELTNNPGVAWGIGGDFPSVVALSSLVLIPLLTWFYWRNFRHAGPWENCAFGCILGGAVGNAWDRLLSLISSSHDGVRDFIRIDLNIVGIDYIWPNFNIADAGISVGFVMLLLLSLFKPARSERAT
jgi:signal peptidase II